MIRKDLIREKVSKLLNSTGSHSAPVNVESIAKHLNLPIEYVESGGEISGCLIRKGNRVAIGVNSSHSENRRRFTIAHEIGHYLLHEEAPLFLDKLPTYRVHFRDNESSLATNPNEIEANNFAAELLMPAGLLQRELRGSFDITEDTISDLATQFGVSTTALTYRLMNLGIIQQ